MLKMKSIITSTVNGKDFEFSCAPDSSFQDALEANSQHRAYLMGRQQMANEAMAEQQKKQVEEPSATPVV